jgi:hypothetical protein
VHEYSAKNYAAYSPNGQKCSIVGIPKFEKVYNKVQTGHR